jgi:hypothetical protein
MADGIRVICPDCGDLVSHHCHGDLRNAIVSLLSWVPETGLATEALTKAFFKAAKEHGWTAEPDSLKQPFFGSQSWSYPLLGVKDTARSFHATLHNVIRAAGFDPDEIIQEIYEKRQRREAEEKARLDGIEKRKTERAQLIAYLQNDQVPLDERIVKLDEILRKFSKGLKPYSDDKNEGFGHLHTVLQRSYGGGISDRINGARIKKLQDLIYEELQAARD